MHISANLSNSVVLDKIKVIYLHTRSTTSDLHRDTFHISTLIFRIATAVLMFIAQGVSAQRLIIPESRNPICWEVRPLYLQDTVTIRFVGDIMMHTKQIETALRSNGMHDFSTYYRLMKDHLDGADLIAGNMEFTLGGEPHTGYPSFSA